MVAAFIRNMTRAGLADPQSRMLDPSERSFWIGLSVVVLSLVSALATYLILTGLTPIAPRNEIVVSVLFINVLLIIAMIGVIAWQIAGLWWAWREKVAGARLHVRIVALFSIIAALPAILLAVAATVTFSRSLDGWFSTRARAIIDNSLDVAKNYLEEHGQIIRTDIVAMARDLDSAAAGGQASATQLRQLIIANAGLRDLPSAYIIDGQGLPVVAAVENDKLPFLVPSEPVMKEAVAGQVPLLPPDDSYRVAAVAQLERFPDRYLYVARGVSSKVMGHLRRTEQNVDEYARLRRARGGLKLAHALMYTMISMTALLAAIWTGMWFAGRFVAPIRRLIGAAQEVSQGNLKVVLPERRGEGDLRRLSSTFNTMTRELKHQRDALVTANEQLTERRRFMAAVLSGVSAGVIGLDSNGRVELVSRSAQKLLGVTEDDMVGKTLSETVPALGAVVEKIVEAGGKGGRPQEQMTLEVGGDERTFAVRVTHEKASGDDVGSVVTFDDITELVSAQRTSAWADVARRIAHEIKNPLTPIQLSAERLKRKYGKDITGDRETFDKLTDTIVRQVGDIKSMVDEFAAFARMPKPEMGETDLRDAVQEPVILFRESHPGIDYALNLPNAAVRASVDRRLISQAITNLVKNSTESVQAAADGAANGWKGRIETSLRTGPGTLEIEVIDNGLGLPKNNRMRLLEPYVTTKGHKGTGLGLAMVHKITEQHGGRLTLDDAPPAPGRTRGALVRITLPLAGSGSAAAVANRNSTESEPSAAGDGKAISERV